jgi:hypothetical protein
MESYRETGAKRRGAFAKGIERMPWQCFLVKDLGYPPPHEMRTFELADGSHVFWRDLKPGAMWFEDGELVVKLPGGAVGNEWNVDRGRAINVEREKAGKKERLPQWHRTGEPPNVTATPSINWVGNYHGWLTKGVLSDDVDGRKIEGESV